MLAAFVGLQLRTHRDPLAAADAEKLVGNVNAGIPPQCYTRTDGTSNPCWVCHTEANGLNRTDDWALQESYDFRTLARTNRWTNLSKDRRAGVAEISDEAALAYIRQDNYAELRRALRRVDAFEGWTPDLDYAQGFDAEGFARDGSGWRAFRYKPFPGTFWPTNGSTDDVVIRLPPAFQRDAAGAPSRDVYRKNLAILEAAIATSDRVADADLKLPAHYDGAAAGVAPRRYDYPEGTEFLHSVRYVDPDAPDLMSARFKEVRYARKRFVLTDATREWRVREEAHERNLGGRPHYSGNARRGLTNAFGWRLQGFIEDAEGRLRLQTREEHLYCMGCHTGIGVTVDQTFALPRKLPGALGWGHQDLRGIPDAPQSGSSEPEYLRYFRRVKAGDEFRANTEMLRRFFPGDTLDEPAVRAARDIRDLIVPSRERALALTKTYMLVVREQSFRLGRDAVLQPAPVHEHIVDTDTALKQSNQVYRDGRLWLDWPEGLTATR